MPYGTDISGQPFERRGQFAGTLGGILYATSGLVVLATAWLLPAGIDRSRLAALATAAVVVGVAVPALPWQRWSRWSRWPAFALVMVAHLHLAIAGWWIPGAIEHYLPLYVLSYLYIGMTQPPRTSLLVAPATAVSFLIATAGGTGGLVNFVVTVPVAVVACEVLSRLLARQQLHLDEVSKVLDATKRLVAASNIDEAARIIGELSQDLLTADAAAVLVADPNRPSWFVSRMQSEELAHLGPISVNIDTEATGVGVAVRSSRTLIVGDAATSPLLSRRLVDAIGAGSVAYVPLFDAGTPVGAIVGVFYRAGKRLEASSAQILDLVAAEAGPIFGRLRDRDRLSWEAETDPLTGIANRRAFNRGLDRSRHGDGLVMIDLDHFKAVNDDFGHAIGDDALRAMSRCLTRAARDGDCVSRFGGEEFAAILPGGGVQGAASFLTRVRRHWAETEPKTTFSAGYATRGSNEPAATTLGRADAALYEAKARGRDMDVEAVEATLEQT